MGCRVDSVLGSWFYKLGLQVGRSPGYFILVPVFLTLLCITGFQRVKFQIDPEYLFSPENGEGKYERAVVESFFRMNYSARFNPTRITRPGRFGRVIILPKEGDDLLSVEVWEELRLLDEIIKNATIVFGEEQRTFTYKDICARWEGDCFQNDILNLDQIMGEVVTGELNLTFPLMINPVTWDAHIFPVYFGGPVVSEDGIILKVPSLQLAYFVNADSKYQDDRGAMWEEAFLDAVGAAEDSGIFTKISTARFASRTLDIELERNTRSVVPYFGSTFLIMTIFSSLTCMMADWVRSKPLLGLAGNLSAAMGTLAGFGLAVYVGIDFIGINFVSPLLMCSIGIDDTFVMLAAWRRTPPTDSVPQRLAATMAEAAVSITITSVTDMVSLWIGILSPFNSIKIFCLYSSFAVFFIFVWHITFFAGCMALSGYAEQKNKHSILCIPVKPVSLAGEKSWLYRVFCTGGINRKDPNNPLDNPENMLMVFFRDSLGSWLSRWPVKVLILITFAAYIAGACYGLTNIKEGLQRTKLSKADSYSIIFYHREDIYFREFPYRMQVVITGDLNYSDPHTQDRIENLTRTFEASPFISNSQLYTESWLRSFVSYVKRNQEFLNVSIDTEPEFIKNLKELWLFKPNAFSLDVKFSDDGKRIVASRMMIQAVNISDGNMEKDMVRDLRRIARESSLNVTVFHPYFVFFDQFELVKPTSIQSMIVGAVIMMIISFIFIPNVLCSLWVAFCIVSIELGVVGYMALWDVNLDSISMINLIMCIGFSVDFTAHICYAYMSSKAETPKEKIKESLYALGLPIFQGAASTILGVIALILAESYIFLVFFKMIFLVVLLGALHGMFLLPVLLSLFAPRRRTIVMPPPPEKNEKPYSIPHPRFRRREDPGLGTSEESSEGSGSEEARRARYLEGWRRAHGRSHSYHNGGFLSDEEMRVWSDRGRYT